MAAPRTAAGIEAAAATTRAPDRRQALLGLVIVALLAFAPFVLAPPELGTLGRILYYALLAASLNVLVGLTGLPSLAHAAWFGIGAYTAGLIARDISTFFLVPTVAAVLMAAAIAAATGWLAVRSHGIFFLMLTLAIGEIVFQAAESWDSLTGGSNGLYGIPGLEVLPGSAIISPAPVYWYVLGGFIVGMVALWVLSRSPFGLALRGIRDNEARMRALGYATFRYKYAAFIAAAGVAGLAGALLASQQHLVTTQDAGFTTAVLALLAVVIGGAGSLWGPCLGAAVVVLVRDQIGPSLGGHGPLLLGIVFVVCVYVLPEGFAGLPRRIQRWRRR